MNKIANVTNIKDVEQKMFEIDSLENAFVRLDVNEPFNNKGVRLVAIYFNVPIDKLIFQDIYQRVLEPPRLKEIMNMMTECGGPWKTLTMTVNDRWSLVDGNHRWNALINLGFKSVPIVHMMEFENDSAEAQYFIDINKMNIQIKKDHYIWRARYIAKHPAAELMYRLVDIDETSKLFNNVSIAERKSTKNRIPINVAWQIICRCCLNIQDSYKSAQENNILKKIEITDYTKIKEDINNFMIWFEKCFNEKKHGSIAWSSKAMRCFIIFFMMLRQNNLLNTTSKYKQSVKKLQTFNLTTEIIKLDQYSFLLCLVNHYNKKKRTNRLPMPSTNNYDHR